RGTMICALATFALVGGGWQATQPPQRPPVQPQQPPSTQPQQRPAIQPQERPAIRPQQAPTLQLKPESSLFAQVVTGPDKQIEWLAVVRLEASENLTVRWKTDY